MSLENSSYDSLSQSRHVEIDEEANSLLGDFHVSEKLRLVNWENLLDRRQLQDYFVLKQSDRFDNRSQGQPLVDNGQCDLSFERQASQVKFITKTFLVRGLKEARSETTMNFDGSTNDRTGPRVAIVSLGLLSGYGDKAHLGFLSRGLQKNRKIR